MLILCELCDLPLFLCCVYPITHPALCSAIALQPWWYCGSVRSDCDPPPPPTVLCHTLKQLLFRQPLRSRPLPVMVQHLFMLAMSKSVSQGVGTQGSAWGTPQSPTGKCNRALNHLGDKYVEGNHTHSADKHGDAHIRAPPYRRLAIWALVCHHISSGHAAVLREFMWLGNAQFSDDSPSYNLSQHLSYRFLFSEDIDQWFGMPVF